MRLSLLASVAAVALGTGTASAQYPAYVPHGNHYHAVPSYPAYPAYGGGGFSLYAADRSGAFALSVGRPYVPSYGYGYGGYNHGYNHNHHHHGYGYGWNR